MEHSFSPLVTKDTWEAINSTGKKTRILLDFSALGHMVMYSCKNEIISTGMNDWSVWKYFMLDRIFQFKQKLKKGTEVVVACDKKVDGEYWRNSLVYPHYKHMRTKKVDIIPKEIMQKNFSSFQDDLKNYFPFKVISVDGAEGDDVIAVLSRDPEYTDVIVSGDFDLYQLTDNINKFLFSISRGFFVDGGSPKEHLLKKILGGDSSDNIPNIESDLDAITNPLKRQKSFTKSKYEEYSGTYLAIGEEGLLNYLKENARERFVENKRLMDLTQVPDEIQNKIKDCYSNYVLPSSSKYGSNITLKYCMTHKFGNKVYLSSIMDKIMSGILT